MHVVVLFCLDLEWYGNGPSENVLFKHGRIETTVFSPRIDENARDRNKTVAKWGKGTILRVCYARDIYDVRIFSDDLGEYIKRDGKKLQTNIILFDDQAKVHTVNITPEKYLSGDSDRIGMQYVLDMIEGFKTKITLEEWDYTKCGGTYWHLRSEF